MSRLRPRRRARFADRRVTLVAFVIALVAGSLAVPAPTALSAQLVGYEPDRSPFRDYPGTQQLSLSAGWLWMKRDPAGVAIDPAPLFSLRHDIAIGGPAWLTTRYAIATGERNIIDPTVNADNRIAGRKSTALHFADLGLALALTGRKTFHNVIPTLQGSIGLTSDFGGTDPGGFEYGVGFAFSYGVGLRYRLQNGWSLRADAINWLLQYEYPDSFFIPNAIDSTSVLEPGAGRTAWRGNWGLTIGLSAPLGRR